jgi:hypothetical protein
VLEAIKQPTIKEAVLKVLDDEKKGLTAQQILAAINERFPAPIEPPAPPLSPKRRGNLTRKCVGFSFGAKREQNAFGAKPKSLIFW